MERAAFEKAYLAIGGMSAGAGVASAIAALALPTAGMSVPIAGALIALLATLGSGALGRVDEELADSDGVK